MLTAANDSCAPPAFTYSVNLYTAACCLQARLLRHEAHPSRLGDRWQEETWVRRNGKMDGVWGGGILGECVPEKLILVWKPTGGFVDFFFVSFIFSPLVRESHIRRLSLWTLHLLPFLVLSLSHRDAAKVCCWLFYAPGSSLISPKIIMLFLSFSSRIVIILVIIINVSFTLLYFLSAKAQIFSDTISIWGFNLAF